MKKICAFIAIFLLSSPAFAATNVPFTIAMSEAVNVTGSPRIAVDVGGVTRYATYASGTGTSVLTFTYAAQAGDVDLDGVTLSSPIDLNGGTITDLNGNPETNLAFTVPDTSGIKIDYPSLSMDFIADADGRYTLNGTAYNDLPAFLSATGGTFARNSVGTYFDSDGVLQTASADQPRFDHDPVTHAPKGILIEESRTNLLRHSIFSGTSGPCSLPVGWTGTGIDSCNPISLIDGPVLGYNTKYIRVIRTAAAGFQGFQNSGYLIGYSIGVTYTISAYIRKPQNGAIAGDVYLYFGSATPSTVLIASSAALTDEWQRFSVNVNFSSNSSQILSFIDSGGAAGKGFEITSPQIEAGAFATSYIPTTTVAVTRAADVLTMPASIGSSGSWFSQFQTSTSSSQVSIFGTIPSTQRVPKLTKVGTTLHVTRPNIGVIAAKSIAPSSTNSLIGAAFSYSDSSSGITGNGLTVSNGSGGGNGVATSIKIGASESGINEFINGTIKKLKYYPARISDTQLQLLTQ